MSGVCRLGQHLFTHSWDSLGMNQPLSAPCHMTPGPCMCQAHIAVNQSAATEPRKRAFFPAFCGPSLASRLLVFFLFFFLFLLMYVTKSGDYFFGKKRAFRIAESRKKRNDRKAALPAVLSDFG